MSIYRRKLIFNLLLGESEINTKVFNKKNKFKINLN